MNQDKTHNSNPSPESNLTTTITTPMMAVQDLKKAEEASKLRLDLLPREIRERIYFFLGVPVAGYCLHDCSQMCFAATIHSLLFLKMQLRHEYAVSTTTPSWEEYASTPKILRLDSASVGLPGIRTWCAGKDVNDDSEMNAHIFPPRPELGIIMTSRFFYEDVKACAKNAVLKRD